MGLWFMAHHGWYAHARLSLISFECTAATSDPVVFRFSALLGRDIIPLRDLRAIFPCLFDFGTGENRSDFVRFAVDDWGRNKLRLLASVLMF